MDPRTSKDSAENIPNQQDNPVNEETSPLSTPPSDNSSQRAGASRPPAPPDPMYLYARFGPEVGGQLTRYHNFMVGLVEIAELAQARVDKLQREHRKLVNLNTDIREFIKALRESDEGRDGERNGGNGVNDGNRGVWESGRRG
ncbi:hypothetical protein TWF718_003813 [Orbilia javanica]|uniref:Uncharacterized protein n=1 Tax=Orbilia javanica TaxID=47235 RepID=A0AAN8N4Y7_9PEZI